MNRTLSRLGATAMLITVGACAGNPEPETEPDIVETPVRIGAPATGPVAPGDCAEALRRASVKQDLYVDRVASPRTNIAAVLRSKAAPAAVRRATYNEVRVSVMVDTLGKPDMKSWTVIKSTNAWLDTTLKGAVTKATFEPALLAGCRVPRVWLGTFTSGTAPAAK